MITALGMAEFKALVRNRTAAVLAFAMPLAMGVYFAAVAGDADAWTFIVALQLLCTMGFTAHMTTTTSLTARRQDHYLKRLRTGLASDAVVLTGVVLPAALLSLAQAVLLVGVSVVAGAPLPGRPDLLLAAIAGGVLASVLAGIATSGLTATAELAQITTTPFFAALLGGGLWVVNSTDARALALPGGAVAELVAAAWGGGGGRLALAGLSLLGWAVAGAALSVRLFRWDARS
ncbi:ABC transporter permease [Saccharothrix obliqua]|uniref:ABC transporter permease n=1 Tax=Saccharothrix obliqua TaxID=2861747 RepID=UPI001C5EBD43|nr:ABC transporter permease [Saccharothrix obliqua]MBW4716943.1 ABC transporter permease [Saccharothrix obliqua]